ncbi:hypothetical protein [Chryseobacterium cheonjiense]|uniref:Lipoprotein n=1 Tax=Chryseobacterium cheonjiense TaxID=2728845 RepID=A0A7Y0FIN5_9FLAO|nr:hypothetical protein [Chryseobacterium cheonjiense]NML57551.1 hypothetical protein [Chryseobacterium cheonjiense]
MGKYIEISRGMNQNILLKRLNHNLFFGFILIWVSCKEENNKKDGSNIAPTNVEYIFVSKPTEKKYQKTKYIGGVWDLKNIKIINLKKNIQLLKKLILINSI